MRKNNVRRRNTTRRLVFSSLMIALGFTLSVFPGSVPVGPTRIFPFQHMINVLTGILLGPAYAAFIALAIGMLRIGFGTGTIFAIAGGVPGAIVVGLVYHYIIKRDEVALTEPFGTAVGALISALLVAPAIGAAQLPSFLGLTVQWELFTIFFLMGSIPGTVLGYVLLKALRRSGVIERLRL